MKTFPLIAAASIAFAAAGTAFAAGENDYQVQAAPSLKTRAEVQAELQQARLQGQLPRGEADAPVVQFVAQKTRAEVRAETLAAIASGELREFNAEPYSAYHTPVARNAVPVVAPVVTAAK